METLVLFYTTLEPEAKEKKCTFLHVCFYAFFMVIFSQTLKQAKVLKNHHVSILKHTISSEMPVPSFVTVLGIMVLEGLNFLLILALCSPMDILALIFISFNQGIQILFNWILSFFEPLRELPSCLMLMSVLLSLVDI